jgi:hypothetical protein
MSSGALFLVMPLLRAFDDPEFTVVGEVVDFVQQILNAWLVVMIHCEILTFYPGLTLHAQTRRSTSVGVQCFDRSLNIDECIATAPA